MRTRKEPKRGVWRLNRRKSLLAIIYLRATSADWSARRGTAVICVFDSYFLWLWERKSFDSSASRLRFWIFPSLLSATAIHLCPSDNSANFKLPPFQNLGGNKTQVSAGRKKSVAGVRSAIDDNLPQKTAGFHTHTHTPTPVSLFPD